MILEVAEPFQDPQQAKISIHPYVGPHDFHGWNSSVNDQGRHIDIQVSWQQHAVIKSWICFDP
jgi:hypothetical protein